jgi:hypothetical protein
MDDARALSGALAIAEEAHKRGAFTDLNKFTLLCLDCHQGVVGQVSLLSFAAMLLLAPRRASELSCRLKRSSTQKRRGT